MANTGNKQATVAYKVRSTDGAPLDVNGKPTSVTGRKQAIAVLAGRTNPNAALYEVEFYFNADAEVLGDPSVKFDPAACANGFISVSVNTLVFDPATAVNSFSLTSSSEWAVQSIDAAVLNKFTLSQTSGKAGIFNISITANAADATGQGYITFVNTSSGAVAKIYLIKVLAKPWILATGTWNMLGFWQNTGLWKF